MTIADSLRRAAGGFRDVVAEVGVDQWQLPTPCEGWNVRQLVGHVAAGCQMAATLADGGSRLDAIAVLGMDHLGDRPVEAIDAALERQQAAFERPGIETQLFHHPAGDIAGAQVIQFRLADLLVHRWDVAEAIGVDDALDPVLVHEVWVGIAPMIPMMATSGMFGNGPSGTVANDAALERRLLDALGRRP